ncbi:hypothetical protein [Acinetobacter beijerinckii]|uniref:Uncharacterized protein n=1 Tax=Acinetobacter beijerinckii CIP 110307 TaxID=1217648 RepID=N9FFC8_9GAMM|nr:hypothetical protein [Acinetobacter beijerinckii]ENW03554.1 hypothetical protein F933_02948 [Acinetobacter beijerinckii CIP 110307]
MWTPKKLNVSQSAFLFSIIVHIIIVTILLKFEAEKNIDNVSTMNVTFISASTLKAQTFSSSSSRNIPSKNDTKPNDNKVNTQNPKSSNNLLDNQLPNFFDLTQDTQLLNSNNLYDPLLDAQNRAKKAIKEAKDVSNLYQANIKPMQTDFLENNQMSLPEPESDSFGLYKVEIIDNKQDLEHYSTLMKAVSATQTTDEEIRINQLAHQVTTLLNENNLTTTQINPTSIEFMVDPVNLVILIKLPYDPSQNTQKIKALLQNISFDSVFISSNLNEKSYSFRIQI